MKNKKEITKEYNELVANIESAGIYDGRGEYDLYECDKCRNHMVTLYKDKGVTPFMIRCEKCGEMMQHTQSSRVTPPSYIKVHNWVRPTLEQTLLLPNGMRDHVLNGGLVLEEELLKQIKP